MPQHQLPSSLINLAVPLHAFCYNRATQLQKQIERPEVIQLQVKGTVMMTSA